MSLNNNTRMVDILGTYTCVADNIHGSQQSVTNVSYNPTKDNPLPNPIHQFDGFSTDTDTTAKELHIYSSSDDSSDSTLCQFD